MKYLQRLDSVSKQLPPQIVQELRHMHSEYLKVAKVNQYDLHKAEEYLSQVLELLLQQLQRPFTFSQYHEAILHPFDYYAFGVNFIRPLVILSQSKVLHQNIFTEIETQLANKENVIFLANHQSELDPQAISLLLEKTHPKLAKNMIFVAGHRVTTDPLAVPFSMGRNLLCIFSKKYIDDDPATKEQKLLHNQQTMRRMSECLSEGGKCIYVAPSGGRDRPDEQGNVSVAPFDPQSIEMFSLMAQRAERKTHFYPLALVTYHLLPPPDNVQKQLGEPRRLTATPIHLATGPELDMEHFPGSDGLDKKEKRKARAQHIWDIVSQLYNALQTT